MALNPADIATVSRLLDEGLALVPAEREPWLAALPPEHLRHAEALRGMLAQEARLDIDSRLASLPRLSSDDAVAHTGDLVGPYRLLREIGCGGMGSVWLAERADGAYTRQVALKLPRLAWGAGLAERMKRECEIGMLLEHPNIARLYDAGVDEHGRPFLALEFVDGQPIDAWCEAQGLKVRERLRLFGQVAKAVAYAHGRLVVHRDLKPSNVLVTPDGQAHLLDFGIAKLLGDAAAGEAGLTQQQGRMMTPHYASPEQVAGEAITVQSDVYSLGVLLYELLTGTLPIVPKRGTLGAVEDAILEGDAPLASSRVKDRLTAKALRGEVDAILAKALQRQPQRRYATADALALDVERYLSGETVAARPDSMGYRLHKAVRRHWLAVSAATAVLVAVLGGSGVAVVQAQRAARSAERERVVKEFVADVFRINSRTDPSNAERRPTTPHALLETGAQLIRQRFAGEPELQAELFGVVGGVFSDMGAYKLAAEYATHRLEALATTRADATEQARGLLALGQALFDDRRLAEAEQRARSALGQAAKQSAVHLDALVLLARVQDEQSQYEALASTLSELDELLDTLGPTPSVSRAWALYLRARAMTVRNRFDEALPVFEQAIDTALVSEGPLSLTAVSQRLALANRLANTSHADRAQQQFDAAARALHQLGGAHEIRAMFAAARFATRRYVAFRQIPAAQALAVVVNSRNALASSPLPMPPWFKPQLDFWQGQIMATSGQVEPAWRLLESSVPALRQSASSLSDQLDLASAQGRAAKFVGRHDLADSLLRERLSLRRQAGQGNHPWAVFDYLLIAENLAMQGRSQEADAVLDQAPRLDQIRGEGLDAERYAKMFSYARAEVRLAAGQIKAALSLLLNAAPAANADQSDWVDYKARLGEALCAAGQPVAGLHLLQQAVAATEPEHYSHAPWLARGRALIGLCAADKGDRVVALRYAVQARADFVAQSGVSPYYKAPLHKLERALGLKLAPV